MSVILRADGRPYRKQTLPMSQMEAQAFSHIGDILKRHNYGLHCVTCAKMGLPDNVTGDNNPASDTVTLTCAHQALVLKWRGV